MSFRVCTNRLPAAAQLETLHQSHAIQQALRPAVKRARKAEPLFA
jgi:hypothetical protein